MTAIEWTDRTWNPVRGCARVSAGCEHCYAERQAHRFSGPGQPYKGLTIAGPKGPRWTGQVRLVPEVLTDPLGWMKPSRVFVNSMSDLFHEDVPDSFVTKVFATMSVSPRHAFQILTKRPQRMRDFCSNFAPLPNVWLGVSCENQAAADERIPLLLQTPAAVRFVSAEPLLGPVQIGCGDEFFDYGFGRDDQNEPRLHWVIVGGESGPGARPCHVDWIRSIVEQCRSARVPVFVKQAGSNPEWREDDYWESVGPPRHNKGADPSEWPEELRVREFPR